MATLNYNLPVETSENGDEKRVTSTKVTLENANPDVIADIIRNFENDGYELKVSVNVK